MQPVTPAFLAALADSHEPVVVVEVLRAGQLVEVLGAGEFDSVAVSGGITIDGTAATRRTLNLTFAVPTGAAFPSRIGDLLAPPNEIRLRQGIRLPDGTVELVPTGVFGISKPETDDSSTSRTLKITGYDRSRRVTRARWTSPYVITLYTNLADAIRAALADRVPGLPLLNAAPTSAMTPSVVLGEDSTNDPWADLQVLARSYGHELFFDAAGVPVLRPVQDAGTTPPSVTYNDGPGGMLVTAGRSFDDTPGYNGVIVVGESPDAPPVRAEVWDTDVASPTYYDPADPAASAWGPVPTFLTSQLITTQQQADDAARAELLRVLGAVETITFGGVPNPALDAGDVVALRRAALRIDARYTLQTLRLPVGPGVMTGTTRARRAA